MCMLLLWSSFKCVCHLLFHLGPPQHPYYQVFTNKVPFHECTRDVTVIRKVMSGERPARPNGPEAVGLSDAIWRVMKRCWRKDPSTRASVQDVLDGLLSANTEDGALDLGDKLKISGLASGFRGLKRSWGRV